MKHLLLALGLLLAATAHAQKQATPAVGAAPVQFCLLTAEGRRFDRVELKLEYGQNSKAQAQDTRLAEAEGQLKHLNSVAAGLNYMTQLGWEFVSVAAMEGIPTPMTGPNTVLGYLLRRRP